jgi:hypothetical protein
MNGNTAAPRRKCEIGNLAVARVCETPDQVFPASGWKKRLVLLGYVTVVVKRVHPEHQL